MNEEAVTLMKLEKKKLTKMYSNIINNKLLNNINTTKELTILNLEYIRSIKNKISIYTYIIKKLEKF